MSADTYLETLDPELGRIVAEYLEASEQGNCPPQEVWLARYPKFALALQEFFQSRRQINGLISDAKAAANEQTLGSGLAPTLSKSVEPARLKYFGDYELLQEIARGGMGVVYRARQVTLNRPVAIKMILGGDFASPEEVARFRTEAEAAANLDHPAIVPIYEIGVQQGQHYFSMKLIEGASLSRILQDTKEQNLTRDELNTRVRQISLIARGIHYAHQRGIIHRDLKPANILIDAGGNPHVTDFGLARNVAADRELTRTGAIVGTPGYMAPEQALGQAKAATTAVDIYGLGAILYATLTGRPPFEGATPLETIMQVKERPAIPPSRIAPEIDFELETICLKCLEKDPDARYRSAGELADDLDRWLAGEPIQALPPNAARVFWRWVSTHMRSVACVLLVGCLSGLLVCVPMWQTLAHNLGGYALIYRGTFPGEQAPFVLRALEAFPAWLGLALFPLMILAFFTMGWFADRLIRPADFSGALLSGLGVGTAAAVTAFLCGIGWQTLIQVAVWPSQADLELLVAKIDNDTTFSGGHSIATRYPADINGNPVWPRYVMKKALADLQARLPVALWYGFLLSVGLQLLPATLQTIAAQKLRQRGDPWYWQLGQLLELSVPVSFLLIGLVSLAWERPLLAATFLPLPLLAASVMMSRQKSPALLQRGTLAAVAGLMLLLLALQKEAFFAPNGGGVSLVLSAVGAAAAVAAVRWRFAWWQRFLIYGIWLGTLIAADNAPLTSKSGLDPGLPIGQRIVYTLLGGGIVVGLMVVFAAKKPLFHRTKIAATGTRFVL